MCAPRKVYQFLLVRCLGVNTDKVQLEQRLAASSTPNLTFREVTN